MLTNKLDPTNPMDGMALRDPGQRSVYQEPWPTKSDGWNGFKGSCKDLRTKNCCMPVKDLRQRSACQKLRRKNLMDGMEWP